MSSRSICSISFCSKNCVRMTKIQVKKYLPPQLWIETIDDILYSIGLCHHSVRETSKRSVLNRPLIITISLIIQILLRAVSNKTDNKTILQLTADFGHYMAIKEYVNTMFILFSMMALLSQSVYHYNHFIGVKPTFVRIFQVLSGSITPSSVGLNHSIQVRQLLNIAKWLPLMKKNNETLIPFCIIAIVFGIHYYSLGFLSSIITGIYPIIFNSVIGYYIFNLLSVQIFLFYILCKYILIKLKQLNQMLKKEKRINSMRIRNILHSCDALYREINEYNSTYWSKFLLIIWSLLGVTIIFLLYLVLFGSIPILIKISITYFLILYCIMHFFILSIASSVNNEANKSYKLFNSFIIDFRKTSKLGYQLLSVNHMKVINFYS